MEVAAYECKYSTLRSAFPVSCRDIDINTRRVKNEKASCQLEWNEKRSMVMTEDEKRVAALIEHLYAEGYASANRTEQQPAEDLAELPGIES